MGADLPLSVSLNGQQYHTLGVHFNLYNPAAAPRVASVRPASGPQEGGLEVELDATNVARVPTLVCLLLMGDGLRTVPATFVSANAATCVVFSAAT